MIKLIFTSSFVLGLAMVPWILTNVATVRHWDALENRKEYSNVLTTKKGQVQVYDPNADAGNQNVYRLPYQYEVIDKTLLDMLTVVEGDDGAATLYKGIARSALTLSGAGSRLGMKDRHGSNLKMSVAGSILGHRDDSQADTVRKIIQRVKEWAFVGYMRSLPEQQQQQMILGEACEGYGVRGCTMLASELWSRQAKTNEERLVLVASTRYYLSDTHADMAYRYAQNLCMSPRLAQFQLKCKGITPSSFMKQKREIKNVYYANARLSGLINSKVMMAKQHLISFPKLIAALESVEKIHTDKNHAVNTVSNIEISVHQIYGNGTSQPLIRMVNNEALLSQGFDSQTNIASVAKLVPLLAAKAVSAGAYQEMAASTDNVFQYFLPAVNDMDIQIELKQLGVHITGSDLYQLTHGHASAGSTDLHLILAELAEHRETKMPVFNRQLLTASISPQGTLHYVRLKQQGYEILVAKSGTHSEGNKALGGLAVFVVRHNQTKARYSIVIRQHAKNHKHGICQTNRCLKPSMRTLVSITEQLMYEIGRHK